MASWRTLALGEEIFYEPGVDPTWSQNGENFWFPDPDGFASFVELPLVDGVIYDVVAPPGVWGFVGVFEIVANDQTEYPDEEVGHLWLAAAVSGPDSPVDLTSDTSDYAFTMNGLTWGGLTLEPRALGLLIAIAELGDQSITVRPPAGDPDPDPPPPSAATWRTLALGAGITYNPSRDLTLSQDSNGFWVPDAGGWAAFAELPLVDGETYVNLGADGSWVLCCLMEIVANDETVWPGETPGRMVVVQLALRSQSQVVNIDGSHYNDTMTRFAGQGLTLAQRALGVQWIPQEFSGPLVVQVLDQPLPDTIKFVPDGFNETEILRGLYTAIGFGTPTRTEDRATFFLPRAETLDPAPEDLHDVPFNPVVQRTVSTQRVQIACAVEFYDASGVIETFGSAMPTRIKITLLDPEYQQIKRFLYVVAGGDKYMRSKVEPPVALGTIDVWTVWADAENER